MAAARPEYYPDPSTPQRQLLTVAELEQLFGPDATVELRSMRPERVEADLEIAPPARPTSRWMAPVLLVVFAAASLLGYAVLRSTAPFETATSLGSWVGSSTLGPTEESPIVRDYRLPALVAKIPGPGSGAAAQPTVEPVPFSLEEPAAAPEPVPPSSLEPPTGPAKPAARAAPPAAAAPKKRAVAQPPAPAPAVNREADDEATRRAVERELDRLASPPSEDRGRTEATDNGATYPPGYIEAEVP